jgi:UDP-N-acetyl-D-galactosamine dehydrogenase
MTAYAVVGLGYVGLGLAIALSKKYPVIGYDINQTRIEELKKGVDCNHLFEKNELKQTQILFTHKIEDIKLANFYFVCVATPAYFYDTPNLKPLTQATEQLAAIIKKGDIIVFESSVYPGTTEDICIPILEKYSHFKCPQDFNVGYSPERINPGDDIHTLQNITKIISAKNDEALQKIHNVYASICKQVYPVSNIATAEAIKILENVQRDINIAIMNEFSKIMHALNLNMHEIIEGAKTKWCFVPYKPGFVGGHCISIDPHYLAFIAKRHGISPDLILTARKINDGMTQFIIKSMLELLVQSKINTIDLTVGIFGITYKENVLDVRNSLSLKLVKELMEFGVHCQIHDPLVDKKMEGQLGFPLCDFAEMQHLSVAIVAVGHDFYRDRLEQILDKCHHKIVMDIPNLFIEKHKDYQQMIYWSL